MLIFREYVKIWPKKKKKKKIKQFIKIQQLKYKRKKNCVRNKYDFIFKNFLNYGTCADFFFFFLFFIFLASEKRGRVEDLEPEAELLPWTEPVAGRVYSKVLNHWDWSSWIKQINRREPVWVELYISHPLILWRAQIMSNPPNFLPSLYTNF